MASQLRPYPHLGKFEGELLIAPLVAESTDEELGDVEGFGWYGLVRAPFFSSGAKAVTAAIAGIGPLTGAEVRLLTKKSGGAIINETSQGFVSVVWYGSTTALRRDWRQLEREYDEWSEGAE